MAHRLTTFLEPQEVDLLGSVKVDMCLFFNYAGQNQSLVQNVNSSLSVYWNESVWCSYTSTNISKSSNTPVSLPQGIFLIWGDRAWPGIPSHIRGGPCSLGRLAILSPNISVILNHTRAHHLHRLKRTTHAFNSDCSDDVTFWNPTSIITASFLTPGVAAAQALAALNKLGCWLAKQTNATSDALSGLLLDVDSIRHATL